MEAGGLKGPGVEACGLKAVVVCDEVFKSAVRGSIARAGTWDWEPAKCLAGGPPLCVHA